MLNFKSKKVFMKVSKFFTIALLGAAFAFSGCFLEKSSEKDILEFWVNNVQYDKSGTDFIKFYPKMSENNWGAFPVTPVAPSKVEISPKASISPPITEAQDFEKGVTYTVTAEDGSTQTFTVRAQRNEFLD